MIRMDPDLELEVEQMAEEILRVRALNVPAFLEGLAGRLDNLSDIFARALGAREPTMPKHAADCREMAARLRGKA